MATKKSITKKKKSALATDSNVVGNTNLEEVKDSILDTFDDENVRKQDKVAIFFNDRDVYMIHEGRENKPTLVCKGGATLSAEEWAMRKTMLKKFKDLNEEIDERRKAEGVKYRWRQQPKQNERIILGQDDSDE